MQKKFEDLIIIVDRLLGEGGCPWDREQTHESLKRYLVEEAYETLEAIDQKDPEKIADELGDVLYQVVFHSALGKAKGEFCIDDVTNSICEKLTRRHTHIFSDAKVESTKDIERNWDKIKKAEKGEKTTYDTLSSVTKSLPALMRAEKVQRKAESEGFWSESGEDALKGVIECAKKVVDGIDSEKNMGKLLFYAVNLSKKSSVYPEEALRLYINEFIKSAENEGKCAIDAE